MKRAGWKMAVVAAGCLVGASCVSSGQGQATGEAISLTFEESETTAPLDAGQSAAAPDGTTTTVASAVESSTTELEGPPEAEPTEEIVIGNDASLERNFYFVVDVPAPDTLNVRSGPGIDKAVVEELKPGEPVQLGGATATLPTGTVWVEAVDALTGAPRGWAHSGFLDPVADPIITGLDGSPAVPIGAQGSGGNGAVSAPTLVASGCNAAQFRISSIAGIGPGGSGPSQVIVGTEPPSGSWDGTLSNTVWSAGPETDRFMIGPGEAVLATLPTDARYYVMALGPGNSEPIVDPATNQPLVNAAGRIDSAAHHTVDVVSASGC